MSETTTIETHAFQAETRQVLRLMIHSLYSNKEIFLRELISNASDALDRLRFTAIGDDAAYEGDGDLRIEIEVDEAAGTLAVRDNGIGMTREDVMENIGTIAKSGTKAFLDRLSGDEKLDAHLIGQFGVGFYSSFIVADKVTVNTRKAGDPADQGVRWESDGGGEYSIEEIGRETHGTEVILHLKEAEKDFLNAWTIKSLISRYSDHIGFPIRMQEKDEDDKVEWKDVNKASALWTLPKSEISDEEYQSFYKYLTHDFDDAMCWAHNRVEGSQSYTTLLYVPGSAPMDLMLQRDERTGLRLYVNRVFIMDAAQQLLPHYLRFIRGVVDSADLPLNVSRELLQENELSGKIRSAVIRRSLDLIGKIAKDDPDQYQKFWTEFGATIKEGVVEDISNRDRISALLRFASTMGEGDRQVVDLTGYVERMPEGQDAIYYITAENHRAASHSPHLEVFRKKGIEVLLMSDRVDEWMMAYFTEFDGKPFKSVAKGDIDLNQVAKDSTEEKADDQPDQTEALDADLLKKVTEALGERVSEVRSSQRLTDSASCLVLGEQEMALHLQRLLEQAGQDVPDSRPVLELNPGHPLVDRLGAEQEEQRFSDLALVLFEQALLSEGASLEDPADFVRRVNALLLDT
ncbi:MAG: molecular chaperone HtpG [Xanthomonadales bacterium]|nr:molecular chaperone HtpG [Gammaproteobacteria bacterium]MBT8053847.1 molecular chaperone HtpG [Gammaproteobacteria bacterium]NNK51814.1 molecular chaperone HtpG [Xanthomonadales bacterium]